MAGRVWAKVTLIVALLASRSSPSSADPMGLSRLSARIPSQAAFLWNASDFTEVMQSLGALGKRMANAGVLSHEDERYKMATALLRKLDSAVRARNPQVFANVPELRLEIVNGRFPEFAVSPDTCLPIPVIWSKSGTKAHLAERAIQIGADGSFVDAGEERCEDLALKASIDARQLRAFVEHLNLYLDAERTSCRFSVDRQDGKMVLRAGGGCLIPRELGARADGVSFLHIASASRYLAITVDSLNKFRTYEGLAGLLAHEMVHVYLAHGMLPGFAEKPSYFYRLGERRSYHQAPSRVMEFESIGRKAREASFKYEYTDGAKSADERIARGDQIEEDDAEIFHQTSNLGIGFFTVEQEADELSLEILEAAGIDLEKAVDKYKSASEDPSYWDSGCKLWSTLQQGQPTPHLLGFADDHHDRCFRDANARLLIGD